MGTKMGVEELYRRYFNQSDEERVAAAYVCLYMRLLDAEKHRNNPFSENELKKKKGHRFVINLLKNFLLSQQVFDLRDNDNYVKRFPNFWQTTYKKYPSINNIMHHPNSQRGEGKENPRDKGYPLKIKSPIMKSQSSIRKRIPLGSVTPKSLEGHMRTMRI